MHRKQAQCQGSHESRDPGVSRVLRSYTYGFACIESKHRIKGLTRCHESHESQDRGVSRLMRPHSASCMHRVKGLTKHEPAGSHES